MAKKQVAAILLVLVAVTSACGGSGSKASVGSVTTTSTTSAVDFAKQYLDVEAPFLERSSAANAVLQTAAASRNIPNLIEALHEAGTINWEFATALLAQQWPVDLRTAIQKEAKMLGDLSEWQRLATESDWTSMIEPMQHLGLGVVETIRVTRGLLGLPSSEFPGTVLNA